MKSNIIMREIEHAEIPKIYAHMESDFPPNERPPFEIIEQSIISGTQKCFIGVADNKDVAYALCADTNHNNFVLLNFFAVFKQHRELKIGTAFLKAIFAFYKHKAGVFIETETLLCAKNPKDEKTIIRRQKFYEKLGVKTFNDIEYVLFSVPMYLNIYPLNKTFDEIKEVAHIAIKEIWQDIIGEEKMQNIVIIPKL